MTSPRKGTPAEETARVCGCIRVRSTRILSRNPEARKNFPQIKNRVPALRRSLPYAVARTARESAGESDSLAYGPVREWNIKRSPDSRPLEVQVGDRYWLRVWDDGSEQAVSIGADHDDWVRGAVSVKVIEVCNDGSVVEETYTRDLGSLKRYWWSESAPPRGRAGQRMTAPEKNRPGGVAGARGRSRDERAPLRQT